MKMMRVLAGRARGLVAMGICVVLLAGLAPAVRAGGRGEPGTETMVRIDLRGADDDLVTLQGLGIDLDGVYDGWARAYVVPAEIVKLRGLGFDVTVLPREARFGSESLTPPEAPASGPRTIPAAYHTYETLTSELQQIATDHPDIVRLSSIGQSVQGRELWMVEISKNPDVDEDEPELAYISSMHGDEVTGKELCVGLIHRLVDDYGTDTRATDLVDHAEIWIMPSMNPDGTFLDQRWNANGYDLNRSFPDQFDDPVNTTVGRQPEVAAVMNWQAGRSIVIKANFHGGELIANYPFDSNPAGASVYSPAPAPDDPVFVSIARTYADNNIPMSMNNSFSSFDNGITNGADWYSINGGMQDWSYVWYGTFELTLEVSTTKWPAASALPGFWTDNEESMLAFLERGLEGVRGVVTDAETGAPLAAAIHVDSDPFPSSTDPDVGDYHRMLLGGSHSIEVSALGYATQTIPVTTVDGAAVRYDVALMPLPTTLEPDSNRVVDGGNGMLDPGETTELEVTLRNLGRAATGVNAHLVATGWYADLTRDDASFADIATGDAIESDAPGYEVAIDPAVPDGHRAGFAVAWDSDQGSGVSDPFFLTVGAPECQTVAATDLPQAILDNSTTTSTLSFPTGLLVGDVVVHVGITHTYIGDLTVDVTSPQGTTVRLHNRSGGSTHDILGDYPTTLTPAESLTALAGESATGTWTMTVNDLAGGDTGTLDAWNVEVCGPPPEDAPPEMKLRDVALDAGSVVLNWWPYPDLTSYRVYRALGDASNPASFVDVTASDPDATDLSFSDAPAGSLAFYLVTGVGPLGEGPQGHFGQ